MQRFSNYITSPFVDDSLIPMRADAANAACLREILDAYYESSGQLVSDVKSSVLLEHASAREGDNMSEVAHFYGSHE